MNLSTKISLNGLSRFVFLNRLLACIATLWMAVFCMTGLALADLAQQEQEQVSPEQVSPEQPLGEQAEPGPQDIIYNMVLIPAGKFTMGCNQFGIQHGGPEHDVVLDAFFIDKYEVTNKLYEKVVPEHRLRRSPFSSCDDCPVSKVSWYEAADYCYLIGKTLPSEAQWEKAAGARNGCEFPWGPQFDVTKGQARGGLKLRDETASVGSYPPNKYGLYDMAGNMWEWVSDWFTINDRFPEIMYNPKGPRRGQMKVRRGGAWSDSIHAMTSGWRDRSHPFSRGFNDIGFRCALNIIHKKR
ncbi:MAG: formylglycine-generating enzyme family protein [Candidatus Nitrohelix vancouverensis]|uniref:Formylglycine-generating enzyme family protein n=1 Tax=Candidatus Nitrohelix vancouverensis TaxID=2705534 RepID=A0A7T0C433_9BACT|nr:MAG: formylglycine-generating enzyme family protein [Candidatus Nitrohelix vancouverensis]